MTIEPPEPLGSVRDALSLEEENVERWIEDRGSTPAKNISIPNCFWR